MFSPELPSTSLASLICSPGPYSFLSVLEEPQGSSRLHIHSPGGLIQSHSDHSSKRCIYVTVKSVSPGKSFKLSTCLSTSLDTQDSIIKIARLKQNSWASPLSSNVKRPHHIPGYSSQMPWGQHRFPSLSTPHTQLISKFCQFDFQNTSLIQHCPSHRLLHSLLQLYPYLCPQFHSGPMFSPHTNLRITFKHVCPMSLACSQLA